MPSPVPPSPPAADATEHHILEAAARTFMERGYEGASMERIAQDSTVGRRTLYNRYESKKALFDATVAHLWRQMAITDAAERILTLSDADQPLRALASILAAFWSTDRAADFVRMILAESIRFPELGESFIERGRNPARATVVNILRHLIARGSLVPHDADMSAAQFIALITGPALWDRIVGHRRPLSDEARRAIEDEAVHTFLARYGA
jgi:AcrR family transcriptional regulator